MHFPHHFYRLPLQFDHQKLCDEVAQINESEWISHPQGFAGNSALILVSAFGEDNHDTHGAMMPCARLEKMPYLQQVMASFNTVVGRARLMRLAPGRQVSRHTDISFYWRHRMRLHIPIVTDPSVHFCCEDKIVHMAEGEAWTFDNWRYHEVHNNSDITRIHLVIDTVGSVSLWDMLEAKSWNPASIADKPADSFAAQYITYQEKVRPTLTLENVNVESVLPPSDVDSIVHDFWQGIDRQSLGETGTQQVEAALLRLKRGWRALWSEHGETEQAKLHFIQFLRETVGAINTISPRPVLKVNDTVVAEGIQNQLGGTLAPIARQSRKPGVPAEPVKAKGSSVDVYDRPIIIVSAPRTGSTLLYETLANNRVFWNIDGESHGPIEGIDALNPAQRGFSSNVLTGMDASDEITQQLKASFLQLMQQPEQGKWSSLPEQEKAKPIRFLEKTPKNALRITFLKKVFPDAKFIYLYRRPEANISSIMDGWKSGRYVTYRELPGWQGDHSWSYLLPEGWQSVSAKPLAEVAWFQYRAANDAIRKSLNEIDSHDVYRLDYDDFLNNKAKHIQALCGFCDVPFGVKMQELCQEELPLSRFTLDAPAEDKWKRNEPDMKGILDEARAYYETELFN